MPRVPAITLVLLGATSLGAQKPGQLRVGMMPSSPTVSRVAVRGDSVFFWQPYYTDSSAYVFDRRAGRFARAPRPAGIDGWTLPDVDATPWHEIRLTDSLTLGAIELADGMPSRVVRHLNGPAIALRGPRIAAERQWRRSRGLPPTPTLDQEEFVVGSHPTDWGPIRVRTFAADAHAVWLGLIHEHESLGEFALGGLMRIDRQTRTVSVVDDSTLLHATVSQMVPVDGGYLLLVDDEVMRLDTAARRVSPVIPGQRVGASEFMLHDDTLFLAQGSAIVVTDMRTKRSTSRGFRLTVTGDSTIYELADETTAPSLDVLAALGVADELGIHPVGDWMRAAVGKVKPVALEYYFPGDRHNVVLDTDSIAADSSVYANEELEGPNAIFVTGLEHPTLLPFLRRVLRSRRWMAHLAIARVILDARDRASIPDLRVALDSTSYPHSAEIATTLAFLGDSTGHRWVRAALADTLRPTASLDTAEHVHSMIFEAAGQLEDPANVPVLLDFVRHRPRYGYSALQALMSYRSIDVWRRALAAVMESNEPELMGRLMDGVSRDTTAFVMHPAFRDSVRMLARTALLGSTNRARSAAFGVIVRYQDVSDLPHLIAALTIDEFAYAAAVASLVQLTGTGVEPMPVGRGTPATRAAAQRWWADWYVRNRSIFKPPSTAEAHAALVAMLEKLNRA